jgi:hypothetical protein
MPDLTAVNTPYKKVMKVRFKAKGSEPPSHPSQPHRPPPPASSPATRLAPPPHPPDRSLPLGAGHPSSTSMPPRSPSRRPLCLNRGMEPPIGCASVLPRWRGCHQLKVTDDPAPRQCTPSSRYSTTKVRHRWCRKNPVAITPKCNVTSVAATRPPSWPARGGLAMELLPLRPSSLEGRP